MTKSHAASAWGFGDLLLDPSLAQLLGIAERIK